VALVAAALLVLAAAPAAAQGGRATPVGVDAVRSEPLEQTVPVIGRLVARQSGVVAARTGGAVAEIKVTVGDRVKKREVVAVLDRDRVRATRELRATEVAQAEAAIATSKAQLDYVTQEMKRLEGLRRSAAFSQARFEDKRQEVVKAESATAEKQAALLRARVNLKMADIELRDSVIRAPYAGVVSIRHIEVGAYVGVGQPVVTLIDDEHLEIEAAVPAERIAGLAPGTPVAFRLVGTSSAEAVVRAVVPEENPLTRTRTVRFTPRFNGDHDNLATNQSVTLHIPAGPARAVVTVHKDAVLNRSEGPMVFVVVKDVARPRPVRLGEAVGGRFEVIDGLKPGETVVVRGNERLRPGQKVRVGRPS
jgi:RND family efflux transporter MFP subunit